jgi:hypothetical protein
MRHCEEHCDEAIQLASTKLDCFAALAMTRIGLCHSSAACITGIQHVPASVAPEKDNDIAHENDERAEHIATAGLRTLNALQRVAAVCGSAMADARDEKSCRWLS